MWNNSCRWAHQRLPLLAGGELVGSDRRKTERHLIGCSDCRGRLQSLQGAMGALHALASSSRVATDAPSLWPSLARQIRESRRPEPSFWSIFQSRPAAWVGMAAVVLLVGVPAATRTASYLQSQQEVRTAKVAPKPPAVTPVAAPISSDADANPVIADASPSRADVDTSVPLSPPNMPAMLPRGSSKHTSSAGGINTSIDVTH